ncbi:MAG: hypothetical protein D3924_01230 [Candidatus Electrothrix sp. AR4]|nr:hypothetical protein [Candidatus Electrothrix sp. AR4]
MLKIMTNKTRVNLPGNIIFRKYRNYIQLTVLRKNKILSIFGSFMCLVVLIFPAHRDFQLALCVFSTIGLIITLLCSIIANRTTRFILINKKCLSISDESFFSEKKTTIDLPNIKQLYLSEGIGDEFGFRYHIVISTHEKESYILVKNIEKEGALFIKEEIEELIRSKHGSKIDTF